MAARKPIAVPWNTWIDELIRQADARGEFDDLPGKGQPIPDLDQPYDEMWWVKNWMKREGVQYLPETLQAKLDLERALETMTGLGTEDGVRREAKRINARIIEVNRRAIDGPPSSLRTIDVDQVVAEWRSGELAQRVAEMRAIRRDESGLDRSPANASGPSTSAASSREWFQPIGAAPTSPSDAAGLDARVMRWSIIGFLALVVSMAALVAMLINR